MRKYLIAVMSILAMVALSPIVAHAQPANFNCSSTCESWQEWITVPEYGAATVTTVSNPTIHNSVGQWDRFIRLEESTSYPRFEVGIATSKGGAGYCTSTYGGGNGLWYFAYLWTSAGVVGSSYCTGVPSADINQTADVEAYIASVGDGCDVDGDEWWAAIFANTTTVQQCFDTEMTSLGEIHYHEHIKDTVMGHQVWGVHWNDNEWENGSGIWSFQSSNTTHSSTNNPPQMYWHTTPPNSSTGGDMYSCDYDSGTTCSIGS